MSAKPPPVCAIQWLAVERACADRERGVVVLGAANPRLPAVHLGHEGARRGFDLSTFPDVSVVCGEATTSSIDANAVTNPTVLVEVTSRSTEDYDRGDKLSHYKQIPALQAVLFVSHRTRCITLVERTATGWDERELRAGESVSLHQPQLTFGVDEVYVGITLDPA